MRLVDADALKAIRFHDLPYSQIVPADCDTDEKVYAYKLGWNDAIDAIVESAPTVDAVEVVRCKDCKKYIPCQKLPIGTSKWCDLFDRATCEMNYCGWGERRTDETG